MEASIDATVVQSNSTAGSSLCDATASMQEWNSDGLGSSYSRVFQGRGYIYARANASRSLLRI
jgi:hypothetical protein